MNTHYAFVGHACDLGKYTIQGEHLLGSSAVLRIGKAGDEALVEYQSAFPPQNGSITWDVDGDTGTLTILISKEDITSLGVGTHEFIISIGDSQPLPGPKGKLQILDTVRDL